MYIPNQPALLSKLTGSNYGNPMHAKQSKRWLVSQLPLVIAQACPNPSTRHCSQTHSAEDLQDTVTKPQHSSSMSCFQFPTSHPDPTVGLSVARSDHPLCSLWGRPNPVVGLFSVAVGDNSLHARPASRCKISTLLQVLPRRSVE